MSFLDVLWSMLIAFALLAYLMVMFSIVTDLFRDRDTSGVVKAVWIVCLIIFPIVTSLIYLILKSEGMARRNLESARRVQAAQEDYVRSVAGSATPADQIARAKELLAAGTIDQAEYDELKAKALA